jgi:hypothetical protein
MWLVLLFSLALGAALAGRKPLVLIPATLILLMIVVRVGSLSGFKWGTIALVAAFGAALLQLSYLVGASLFAAARLPTRRELIRDMQWAIGQELRDYFQAPQDVPQKIRLALAESDLQKR